MFSLLLTASIAHAGSTVLQNDSVTEGDSVNFQSGFWNSECWASVYTADPGDYPFDVDSIEFMVYGAVPDGYYFFNMHDVAGDGGPGETWAETYIAVQSATASFNQLVLLESEWSAGGPIEITSGSFAVSMCVADDAANGSATLYPQIATDSDGISDTKANWLYSPDLGWVTSKSLGLKGDWVMRATISGPNIEGEADADADGDADSDTDSDSDADSDLDLFQITPDSVGVGEAIDIVLIGSGFQEGAEARVGGISFVGVSVTNSETITARTPTTLPEGLHDVEVVNPDGESVFLAEGLEVGGAGCGCSSSAPAGGAWFGLLGLVGLVGLRRRR